MFSSTCFTLLTICSIELDTSFTLPESTDAVSFSSSPAAPSSRIELLDSSTDTLSVCELSAIPRTCRLIASIDVVVCWIPFTWSAVTDDTASETPAISPAVASTRSAASDTRPTVARSELAIASNDRDSSPSSSSLSYTSPRRRSPDASRSASPRNAAVARLTSCASNHASDRREQDRAHQQPRELDAHRRDVAAQGLPGRDGDQHAGGCAQPGEDVRRVEIAAVAARGARLAQQRELAGGERGCAFDRRLAVRVEQHQIVGDAQTPRLGARGSEPAGRISGQRVGDACEEAPMQLVRVGLDRIGRAHLRELDHEGHGHEHDTGERHEELAVQRYALDEPAAHARDRRCSPASALRIGSVSRFTMK